MTRLSFGSCLPYRILPHANRLPFFGKRALLSALFAIILISCFVGRASAQQLYDGNQTLPPFGSYTGSDFDLISLQNGNVHIKIPVLKVPQRGDKELTWSFIYDTPPFQKAWQSNPTPQNPNNGTYAVLFTNSGGWWLSNPVGWGIGSPFTATSCNSEDLNVNENYVVTDPEGAKHPVSLVTATAAGTTVCGETDSGPGLDGSGIWVKYTPSSGAFLITLKDGTQITPTATTNTIQDTNGNIETLSASGTVADTLNRDPLIVTVGSQVQYTTPLGATADGPQYTLWTTTDSNGTARVFRVDYTAVDVTTTFCGGQPGTCTDISGGARVVPRQLTIPNPNTTETYQFAWYNNSALELQQITLPTGGTIAYTYGGSCMKPSTETGRTPNYDCRRAVTSRTVTQNGSSAEWTYSSNTTGKVVTDPLGNDEVHAFSSVSNGSATSAGTVETLVQSYSGCAPGRPGCTTAGTLIRSVATSYASDLIPLTPTQVGDLRPISKTTTLDNGQVKQVQTDYETFSYSTGSANYTGTRLNATEVREYAYGSGAPGSLLRRTDYTYLHNNNSIYATLNIVDRVASTTVYDSTSAQCQGQSRACSQTIYEYDNYSHANQPMTASGAVQHASTFTTSYTTRGNQTAVERWRNTDGSLLTTTSQFDDAGNLISSIDPLLNKTTFDFTDSWTNSTCAPSAGHGKAYVTKITNTLSQITSKKYYSCTGILGSATDPNTRATSYSYDFDGRLTQASYPDGGLTTWTYSDAPASLSVEKKEAISSSQTTDEFFYFDGLGREISHSKANGESTPWDKADTCYDGLGRKSFASYPYQASASNVAQVCSGLGDSFAYDALSRILTVTHSDGSVLSTNYIGRATDVVDEGNGNAKHSERVSQVDALGRLTSVCEASGSTQSGPGGTPAACGQDIAKTGFLTTYTYDVLGNMLSGVQGSMAPRTFTFDSLSHVITTANPESGTTCYGVWSGANCVNGYDADGNLLSRTRPAPNQTSSTTYITTTYQYDALNRVKQTSYSDGKTPTATFVYDLSSVTMGSSNISITNGIGRLSSTCTASGSTCATMSAFSYDPMGRTLRNQQATPTQPNGFAFNYTYDLEGDELTRSNGNGITYTLSYNVAPRLTQIATNWMSSTVSSGNLITSFKYNAFGDTASSTLYNNINESWGYDARGRVQSYSAQVSSTTRYSFTNVTYSGNGGVLSNSDTVNGTWAYAYDDFNRVSTSSCTATCPNASSTQAFSYSYDRYGNRWNQTVTAGSGPQPQLTFNGPGSVPNNRIDGFSYDAVGNLLNDATHTYTYDAENRVIQVDGGSTGTYTYDAHGRRAARKTASSSWEYLFDLAGRAVTELVAGTTTTNRTEAYAGGRHLATQNVGLGTSYFIHSDWLGTERARTNIANTVVEKCQSLPFGDGQVCTGTDVSPLHFTGKERDTESNLDDFDARYYSSQYARFMTPDWDGKPVTVPYAKFGDPQTLNLYSYVENAPLNRIDADGHVDTALAIGDPDPSSRGNAGAPEPGLTVNSPAQKAEKQAEKAQNNNNNQTQPNQPAPGEAHKGEPTSLQPTGSTPAANGAKTFTYQVVDPTGRPVRDVSVQEHVKVVAAENVDIVPNPNPVHYPAGVVSDRIGPLAPPTQNSFLKTEQTFTATKGGNAYEMSTKVNQYVRVTNGNVTVQTVVIVP